MNFSHFLHRLLRRLQRYGNDYSYRRWLSHHDHPEKQACLDELKLLPLSALPTVSILLPICNPPLSFLQEAITSVLQQSWPHWELCMVDDASTDPSITAYLRNLASTDARIKLSFHLQQQGIAKTTNDALTLASSQFVAFLDHDDLLAPQALAEIITLLKNHPTAGMLYTDEDKIDRYGRRCDPFFKPDWNPDLLTSLNYCCHVSVLRRSLVLEVGGLDSTVEGAQDWDLLLRITERLTKDQILHLPKVLYHWRISRHSTARSIKAKPYVTQASQRVLERHLQRTGRAVTGIKPVHLGGHWQVRYALPQQAPLVSLIIQSGNQKKQQQRCLKSILRKTDYPHYEILLVDQNDHEIGGLARKFHDDSSRGAAQSDADKEGDALRRRLYVSYRPRSNARLTQYPSASRKPQQNYREIFGLDASEKIRIIKAPNCAVAEARGEILVFLHHDVEVTHPCWLKELVSHAIRPEVGAVGAWIDDSKDRIAVVQNVSAVTDACLAVRKELFLQIGGMDGADFSPNFNNVSFCLKLQKAGYWNVWTPFTALIRHVL